MLLCGVVQEVFLLAGGGKEKENKMKKTTERAVAGASPGSCPATVGRKCQNCAALLCLRCVVACVHSWKQKQNQHTVVPWLGLAVFVVHLVCQRARLNQPLFHKGNNAIKLKEVLEGFIEKQRKDNNLTVASC